MKILPLLLSILFLSTSYSDAQRLEPKEKNGKWGLFDGKKKIIDFIYDEITDESTVFYVKSGNHIGMLNLGGYYCYSLRVRDYGKVGQWTLHCFPKRQIRIF